MGAIDKKGKREREAENRGKYIRQKKIKRTIRDRQKYDNACILRERERI